MADYDIVLQSIADSLSNLNTGISNSLLGISNSLSSISLNTEQSIPPDPILPDDKKQYFITVLSKFKQDFWNIKQETIQELNSDGTTTEKIIYYQTNSSHSANFAEVTNSFISKVDSVYSNLSWNLSSNGTIFLEIGYENAFQFNEFLFRITEEIIQSEKNQLQKNEQVRNNKLIAEQNKILNTHSDILTVIKDDIHRLRERGDNTHLGIVHRGIHWEAEDCKNRTGIMRMALKDSDLLDDFSRARAEEDYYKIFTDCGV